MQHPHTETLGRTRFKLGSLLGAGTFGEVYLARMTSPNGIEQDVAVKLLNPGLSPRSQPVSRMRDEGVMLASLNHPAILSVMDFCVLEGRIGLVTEYVPGEDLHDAIYGSDPIPPRAALQAIAQIAEALDAAFTTAAPDGEQLGLVHRDIKPANIRLTKHAAIKLLDFGIAKSEDARRETATTERVAIGTPAYMAPEVQTYEVFEALPSRDVFALGCTLYESLAREMFFEGLDPKAIVRLCNRKERFLEWSRSRMPKLAGLPAGIVALAAELLRYDHENRPTSREVADLCHKLEATAPGETLRAWARRRQWPSLDARDGPWTGRTMSDAGTTTLAPPDGSAGGPQGGSNKTLAPMLDDPLPTPMSQQQANPTIVVGDTTYVPQANPTMVPGQATQVGGTQVVVVTPERTKTKRGLGLGDVFFMVVALVVFVGLIAMWQKPHLFRAALNGEWAYVAEEFGVGALAASGPVRDWSGADGGGESTATVEPQGGKAWGATSTTGAAIVELGGDWDIRLQRAGQPLLRVDGPGEVAIPPGPVSVRARFAAFGEHAEQFTADLRGGDVLRVHCDVGANACIRR